MDDGRAGMHRRTQGKTHHGSASCAGGHQWICTWMFVKTSALLSGATRTGNDQQVTPATCPQCGGAALRLREGRGSKKRDG